MESSGSAALDRASCKQVLRNARFKPATDASGQIIEDNVSVPLNWVLPE